MKILFDISHPAHINFFKTIISRFHEDGNEIYISVLQRGKLLEIVKKEFNGYVIIKSGRYRNNKFSIIIEANLFRFFLQLFNIIHYGIDFGLSVGSFTFGAAMKLLRKKNIQFDDDPERKLHVLLEQITATIVFFPPVVKERKNIRTFNALKEWSYLSPKYFSPNLKSIEKHCVKPKEYIFIREVQTKSLNYSSQASDTILLNSKIIPKDLKVILSLEDKSKKNLYPTEWIILEEPVDDIHSLIYYSILMISTGDSMAREGAMLGIPSIYCGNRFMNANQILIDKGLLFHIPISETSQLINDVMNNNCCKLNQNTIRDQLFNQWTDLPDYIYNFVKTLT
ncbi:MAG: DUF354 domain-containing protein [Candidatus Delongbacteria bacterium]|nr:DUF354 domain-containing protein [Candidatus Delongbacteria bacterium]